MTPGFGVRAGIYVFKKKKEKKEKTIELYIT